MTTRIPDQRVLQQLIGYNCRRAYHALVEHALKPMARYELRPVSFSALVLIRHNPGVTSRQVCRALGMQPPNLVAIVDAFEARGLVERRAQPRDRRALGLHLTEAGERIVARVESEVADSEIEATAMLSRDERRTLVDLLCRIYTPSR